MDDDFIRKSPTCSLLGGMGDGGREGVVLDFGGGGEIISSVSSALPKDPSSMLAFEESYQNIVYEKAYIAQNGEQYTDRNTAYRQAYGMQKDITVYSVRKEMLGKNKWYMEWRGILYTGRHNICCIPGLCSVQLTSDSVPLRGEQFPMEIFPL